MSRRFFTLFWRQCLRPALRRPGLAILNTLSLALGVAVFLAIQLANRGALSSFQAAADLTTGRAHLEVRGDLDEMVFPRIRDTPGVLAASPVLEGLVTLEDYPGEYLRIVGIDPLMAAPFSTYRLENSEGGDLDFERWLRQPGQVAVMASWLGELGIMEGRPLRVLAGSGRATLTPGFRVNPQEAIGQAANRVGVIDIGWAQELLGQTGRLSSVALLLEDEANWREVAGRLAEFLPGDVRIAPPAARNDDMRAMVAAFQLNLTAMSLVSVVVGMFLIFNSVSASVVRRQREIAILRSAGATRGEVRGLFLAEAGVEAVAGSALGILAAPWLAKLASAPVSGTVSSLYEVVTVSSYALGFSQVATGFAVGLVAALFAAWLPASEAAGIEPARILHRESNNRVFAPRLGHCGWLAAGLLLLAGLAGWGALNGGPKVLGFLSAAFVLAGFTALVPAASTVVARAARQRGGMVARLAADHFSRSLHRNGVTIAALSAAVAMAVAVTVMIHSFRASVVRWVGNTLTADLYVAPAANEVGGLHATLPDAVVQAVRSDPRVKEVGTFREFSVSMPGGPVSLAVVSGSARGQLEFLAGSPADALETFQQGRAVAVSESYVSRFGHADKVTIDTPEGKRSFPVCGVYRDFTRDRGTILMPAALHAVAWNDPRLHSLSITLADPADTTTLAAELRKNFPEAVLAIYDNVSLKQRVFEIFEQTFAVTLALRAVAVIVAVVGITFSMTILVSEREREIGVLRSLGASRGQILAGVLRESWLIGVTSALCGLGCGAVLAMVLTWVVNKAFFGWSIALTYPLGSLLLTPLWLIPVAAAAALYPAWRAAHIPPAAAVRFE
ncbi:MAG: ABC transporter permease [Terrimicrobiaceae bacterium]